MIAIHWNKPIEVFVGLDQTWKPAKYIGMRPADGANKANRVVTTPKGAWLFTEEGTWENDQAVTVRNVPEKKRYTTITFRNKDGSISASVQSGVGIKNCEVGKEFYGKPIVHVAEFEVAV